MRRADNIVRDAEAVRMALVAPDAPGGGKWSILGQSFGGFCAVRAPSAHTQLLVSAHSKSPLCCALAHLSVL